MIAGKWPIQGVWGDLLSRVAGIFVRNCSPPPPPPPPSLANPPAPLPQCRAEFYPTTTQPNWTVYLDIGLLGNFPEGQVAGCRCTLLAGNSCISLAGSEEQIYVFPGNLPICLKWLRKGLFMLCCCFQLFLSKFPVGWSWTCSSFECDCNKFPVMLCHR